MPAEVAAKCALKAKAPRHLTLVPYSVDANAWTGPRRPSVLERMSGCESEVGLWYTEIGGDNINVGIDEARGSDLGCPSHGHLVQHLRRDFDANPHLTKPCNAVHGLNGVLRCGLGPFLLRLAELCQRGSECGPKVNGGFGTGSSSAHGLLGAWHSGESPFCEHAATVTRRTPRGNCMAFYADTVAMGAPLGVMTAIVSKWAVCGNISNAASSAGT